MRLVDSHCHLDRLDLTPYGGELAPALQAARERGVDTFLCVGIDKQHTPEMLSMVSAHPQVWASVGLHPTEQAGEVGDLSFVQAQCAHARVVAVGETGLDYHHVPARSAWQIERFDAHLEIAATHGKPVVIHSRQAGMDVIERLKPYAGRVRGVLHCFTESLAVAHAAVDLGFYIGVGGIITFKNADLVSEVAQSLPLDSILLETDSPYLAPVPHRGKPNYPAYVFEVAEKLAQIRGIPLDQIAHTTTANFNALFLSQGQSSLT